MADNDKEEEIKSRETSRLGGMGGAQRVGESTMLGSSPPDSGEPPPSPKHIQDALPWTDVPDERLTERQPDDKS